jgi:hypothetical protein
MDEDSLRADCLQSVALPLSVGQQALWMLMQLSTDAAAYNIHCAFLLSPQIDLMRLRRALEAVYRRHDLLRACFVVRQGVPVTIIPPCAQLPLVIVDGEGWDELARDAWIESSVARPFDLALGPPVRFMVLRRSDRDGKRENVLLVVMSHIVGDFRSIDILVHELPLHYQNNDTPWAAPTQFSVYASREQSWLRSCHAERSIDFWRTRLPAADPRPLGGALPLPRPFFGIAYRCAVATDVGAAIRDAAKRTAVTPYVFVLSAYAILLSALTGRLRIVIGSAVDLRLQPDLRNTVGYLVNIVPLPLDLEPRARFFDLLAAADRMNVATLAHRRLPFAHLVQHLGMRSELGRSPLYQALFSWLKFDPAFGRQADGTLIADTITPRGASRIGGSPDFALTVEDRTDRLECLWTFDAGFFGPDFGAEVSLRLEALLRDAAANPQQPIAALLSTGRVSGTWSDGEREQIEL